jgi:predicted transcriptional regulator
MASVDQQLNSYIMQLNEAEKKSVLLMLKIFLKDRDTGISNISIEQYNKEIDEALQDAEEGLYITQDEMEKMAAKW